MSEASSVSSRPTKSSAATSHPGAASGASGTSSSDSDPDQTCHFTPFAFHLELVEIQKGLPSE